MARFIVVNDIHITEESTKPRWRSKGYRDQILAKIREVVKIAERVKADAIICTGDVFHEFDASHTTHRLVQMVRDAFGSRIPIYIVPGNHDEARGGGLFGQPLMSLYDANIRPLDGTQNIVGHGGGMTTIVGIPWDRAFEGEHAVEAFRSKIVQVESAGESPTLVFTHCPITDVPSPFGPLERGWIMDTDLASAMPDSVKLIAHGHMHKQQPIATHSGIVFANPGALSRASIAEDDQTRAPSVALIDYNPATDALSVEYLVVDHLPVAEVFRLDELAHDRAVSNTVSAVAFDMAQHRLERTDSQSLIKIAEGLPRPEGVDADIWPDSVRVLVKAIDKAGATA